MFPQAEIAEVPTTSLPDMLDGYSLVPTLKGHSQEQPEYVPSNIHKEPPSITQLKVMVYPEAL